MAEPRLTLPGDEDEHDLPRTLRRARAEQAHGGEARYSDTTERRGPSGAHSGQFDEDDDEEWASDEVTVTRLRIPFFHLMGFFVKAAFAAIPALIILTIVLIGIGTALKNVFPGLRQAIVTIEVKSP